MTALNPAMRVGDQIAEAFEFHAAVDGPPRGRGAGAGAARRRAPARAGDLAPLLSAPALGRPAPAGDDRDGAGDGAAPASSPTSRPRRSTSPSQAQILRAPPRAARPALSGVLFITHDFDVVAEIADRVVVMQSGASSRAAAPRRCCAGPQHDYTQDADRLGADGSFRRRRGHGEAGAAARGRGPAGALRDRGDPEVAAARRPGGGRASSLRRSPAARPSAWSANRARARRRSAAAWPASRRRPRAASCSAAQDLARMSASEWQRNCKKVQMVFQDPFRSFNPRLTVRRAAVRGAGQLRRIRRRGRAAHARDARAGAASTRARSTAIRTSSPAASGSACRSRGP